MRKQLRALFRSMLSIGLALSLTVSSVVANENVEANATSGTAVISVDDWVFGESAKEPIVSSATNNGAAYAVYYKLASDEDSEYKIFDENSYPINAGEYIAKVVYEATGEYDEAVATDGFTILQKTLTRDMFSSIYIIEPEYTGYPVEFDIFAANNAPLTDDDYSIEYENNINVGIATVKIIGNGNYTGTITETFTINKGTPEIVVSTTTYVKTYGDAGFNLNAWATIAGTLIYTADDSGVVSVDAAGNVTILKAGTGEITISMDGSDNYNAAESKVVEITVNKKESATLVPETKSYKYSTGSNGTASIDLSKKLPRDMGAKNYSVSISDKNSIISDASVINDELSFIVKPGASGDRAAITVTILSENYKESTFVVNVSLASKEVPILESIKLSSNELTYGNSLKVLSFRKGEFVDSNNNSVDGTLDWENPYLIPTVATTSAKWRFKPTNSEYASVTGYLPIVVNKATPIIELETKEYNVTIGDPSFKINASSTSTEGVIKYEEDLKEHLKDYNILVDSEGNVSILRVGTGGVKVSMDETANYNAAEIQRVKVIVSKKAAITIDPEAKEYSYMTGSNGTVSIDLKSKLPSDYGDVTYTPVISDNTIVPSVTIDGDNLVYNVNSGASGSTATITVTIATTNYEDMTYELTVSLVDKIAVSEKQGNEVAISGSNKLAYGDALSKLLLNTTVAKFVDPNNNVVEGTLSWETPSLVPTVGTTSAIWKFTPTDEKYTKVTGELAIIVNKATPSLTNELQASSIVYGKALSDVTLTGGEMKVGNTVINGSWTWKTPSVIPTVENTGYVAVFTPEDSDNYVSVEETVTVVVSKATLHLATTPSSSVITYGQTLNDSSLSGGEVWLDSTNSTEVAGTWKWAESTILPKAGIANYTVVFTPNDASNYNSVECSVSINVSKATPKIELSNLSHYTNNVSAAIAKLVPSDSTASVVIEYGTKKNNGTEEITWSSTIPTVAGDYSVRAYLPNGTDNLNAITVENAVTGTFSIKKRSSGGGGGGGGGSSSSTKLDTNKTYSTIPEKAVVKELGNNKSATVKLNRSQDITEDVISTMKGKDVSLTIEVMSESKVLYSLTFDGNEINESKTVKTGLTFTSPKRAVIEELFENSNTKILNFEHSGTLPGKMVVKVDVSDTYGDGTVVDVYHFDEVTDELTLVQSNIIVTAGYSTFTLEHCSTYVVVDSKALSESDLDAYSKMDMNVYDNSRVTSIKKSGNGFVVEGYMFEENADCIYADTRNWREIVFVNVDDASTEKAYRKQTTNIYNPWLNSNMTATANGKYKLNYANYRVEVNPSSINKYAGNVPGYKIASGTYYVYMRISNGKTSYLFPLVDRTLANGTNMENTNMLPDGFTVKDPDSRILVYTVK